MILCLHSAPGASLQTHATLTYCSFFLSCLRAHVVETEAPRPLACNKQNGQESNKLKNLAGLLQHVTVALKKSGDTFQDKFKSCQRYLLLRSQEYMYNEGNTEWQF
jgi:hypothetical protein